MTLFGGERLQWMRCGYAVHSAIKVAVTIHFGRGARHGRAVFGAGSPRLKIADRRGVEGEHTVLPDDGVGERCGYTGFVVGFPLRLLVIQSHLDLIVFDGECLRPVRRRVLLALRLGHRSCVECIVKSAVVSRPVWVACEATDGVAIAIGEHELSQHLQRLAVRCRGICSDSSVAGALAIASIARMTKDTMSLTPSPLTSVTTGARYGSCDVRVARLLSPMGVNSSRPSLVNAACMSW